MEFHRFHSRRLHGRRGLKLQLLSTRYPKTKSPPSRAAWIEIEIRAVITCISGGRRLHGRRGLKCAGRSGNSGFFWSPPSQAAWIEILINCICAGDTESPPSRAAWIEIPLSAIISAMYRSLHSQVVCMQRFACVICLRSESSLIKNRVTAF